MTHVEPLMSRNFIEYASYVIIDRAIPDLRDGLKPVQRRILATLTKVDDGRFHKVANIIGETMKLHPHGDASIGDALVVLANKEYFIEKQGNFGSIVTGHAAAAARYIECRLTDLARETLFKKELTEYRPSYDGRNEEPVALPAKIPVLLMIGAEGIAVGMSTRILPHNFPELLRAQIAILQNAPVEVMPDFPTSGLMDVSEYDDGRGKVRVRARIEKKDEKTVVIREVPYGVTTESLIASIEGAAQKGKIKIGSIDDFTTEAPEIEIGLPRGVYADEVIPQLYAHTDCEVSISSNIVIIRGRRPVEMPVSDVLYALTEQLRETLRAELEYELGRLEDVKHWLSLERIFIENRIYKRIETATTKDGVKYEIYAGLEPFADQLERPVSDDDIERLLEIPIRRISQYDIDKNRDQYDRTVKAIAEVQSKLKHLTKTTIAYLEGLLETYGRRWPRRTEVTTFDQISVRAVARQNIKLCYDPDTGFFGSDIKAGRFEMQVSEYDKILLISKDGSYRVVGPEDKMLVPGRLIWAGVLDPDEGRYFTVVYRFDDRMAYAKKVHIKSFIRDREYELIKDCKGRIDFLMEGDADGGIHLDFVPAKRQRVHEGLFDLAEVEFQGVTARGRRLAPKPVARIKRIGRDALEEAISDDSGDDDQSPDSDREPAASDDQPGLFDD
jgi:topoisomerase-4 subunit A